MREILFRGKRLDNGLWVVGYLFVTRNGDYEISNYDGYLNIGQSTYMVDSETIGQYTGLKDRNGKKIFEGDILTGFEYPFFNNLNHNYFAEVIWFDDTPAFGLYTHKNPEAKVRGCSAGLSDYMDEFNSCDWEVIGNIFDNPELLEESK